MDAQMISFGWESISAIVAGTGVVTAGLTAFAIWLVLRFTKPLDAYATEFAKQVARHQKLETKRRDGVRAMEDASLIFQRATDTAPLMIPDAHFKPLLGF